MNLPVEEAALFFKLFFALLAFTNRELKVVPGVSQPSDIPKAKVQGAKKIRDALYHHPDLFARFAAENPERFTPEELTIITSWKHRISGEFYLMRLLKKYAVFMPAKESDHLYGVLGLYDPIDAMVDDQPLPVLLETTLLPFKNHIIYDGIVAPYALLFGPGIRSELGVVYKRLKAKEGIIEQLLDAEGKPQMRSSLKPSGKPAPDWKPLVAEIAAQTDKMRKAGTPEQSAALGLLRAAAHLAQVAYEQPDGLASSVKQVKRAVGRLETVLYEEEF